MANSRPSPFILIQHTFILLLSCQQNLVSVTSAPVSLSLGAARAGSELRDARFPAFHAGAASPLRRRAMLASAGRGQFEAMPHAADIRSTAQSLQAPAQLQGRKTLGTGVFIPRYPNLPLQTNMEEATRVSTDALAHPKFAPFESSSPKIAAQQASPNVPARNAQATNFKQSQSNQRTMPEGWNPYILRQGPPGWSRPISPPEGPFSTPATSRPEESLTLSTASGRKANDRFSPQSHSRMSTDSSPPSTWKQLSDLDEYLASQYKLFQAVPTDSIEKRQYANYALEPIGLHPIL
jgi:hypothetical protein